MFKRLNQLAAVLMLVTLISAAFVSAQQRSGVAELEKVALTELAETNTPGAVVVVVSGDRPVLVKGFGVANIETGVPVTTDTVFRISGITKFITATVLVSLAEEGKIDLNAPIGRYLKGLGPKLSRVTAQQLLSETAGVKEDHLLLGLYDDAALGNIVRSWNDDWLIAEPGRIQSGSHPGYAIAGLLIEEVAGKPFADAMSEWLLSPLGMTRSTFRPLVALTYPFSVGHSIASNQKPTVVRPFATNSVGWPSSSLFSTGNDLSRFLIAFLNGGKLDGRQVVAPAVIARLKTVRSTAPVVAKGEESYGLASSIYGSHHVLRGNYGWAGIRALIRIGPEARFATIIFSNGGSRHLTNTTDKIMQTFLGPPTASTATTPESLPMTKAEMSRYIGTYENESVVTLFLNEGALFIRDDTPAVRMVGSHTGSVVRPVSRIGATRFSFSRVGTSEPTFFTLIAGDNGRIEYLHIGSRGLKRK